MLASRESLRAALEPSGWLLLRGTAIRSATAMRAALAPLLTPMNYVGGTNARKALAEGVLDAGTEPPHLHIPEHSEMAYLDRLPLVIAFACLQPATGGGGGTTVVASADVEQALPAAMARRLREVGVQHVMYYGVGGVKTWQDAFETQDPKVVEDYAAERGWGIEWTPEADGVSLSFTRASYVSHPWFSETPPPSTEGSDLNTATPSTTVATSDPAAGPILCQTDLSATYYVGWEPFCSADFHRQPYSFRWGDGAEFTQDEKDAWGVAKETRLQRCQWQVGDLLILDNIRMQHGRLPYEGDRTMAVVLGEPHTRCHPTTRPSQQDVTWADHLAPECRA